MNLITTFSGLTGLKPDKPALKKGIAAPSDWVCPVSSVSSVYFKGEKLDLGTVKTCESI